MAFHRNADYVISAGTVTFHPRTQDVLVILNKKYGEDIWQLPKGRRNIGEDICDAAVRETYEETGYHVRLSTVRILTRATRPRGYLPPEAGEAPVTTSACGLNQHHQNQIDDLGNEPVGMVTYTDPLTEAGAHANKMCFFFLATLADPDAAPHEHTQDVGEQLEAKWMRVVDARLALRFDAEREVLVSAEAHWTRAASA
ncbi:NUDIX hydrolase domain-like protein [Coniella lustricola]|uniref:NUDIX hydrolase domain-like protein n=1 Tax=Coniella lustricola TaxID=2025994 RepID=A0A2T3ABZ0_9PEZI|nr:NUDIX hydrolase domain-like protein [Coniella lustricola]